MLTTNQQKPEPYAPSSGTTLDVHSVFPTVQGEGPFAGHRAVFVRLAGCNFSCPRCDTEYTRGRYQASIAEILGEVVRAAGTNGDGYFVVITGGEPLRQTIGPLVNLLLYQGFRVQIESNGACPPDDMLDRLLAQSDDGDLAILVVSPKTKKIHPRCMELAHCFKYVVDELYQDGDGLPIYALEHEAGGGVARPRPGAPVYLTPCDVAGDPARTAANLKAVVRSARDHGYIAGVQLHKLFGIA